MCIHLKDHRRDLSRKTSPQLFGGLGVNTGLQPHILKLICDVMCVSWKCKTFDIQRQPEKYCGSGMEQSFCIFVKDNLDEMDKMDEAPLCYK